MFTGKSILSYLPDNSERSTTFVFNFVMMVGLTVAYKSTSKFHNLYCEDRANTASPL
jgi:hypothetical protein